MISIFEKYDSASWTFVISTFESGDNDVVENQCKVFLKKTKQNKCGKINSRVKFPLIN